MHNRRYATKANGPLGKITSVVVLSALVVGLSLSRASAQDIKTYTRATFDDWFSKYKDAKPDFKPGDVLTAKDTEKMRPFIPPGNPMSVNKRSTSGACSSTARAAAASPAVSTR